MRDLYTVDGRRRERRITVDRRAIDPAWSPRRGSLVFASDTGESGAYGLYRVRLSDRRETRLTRPSGASDVAPAVRADGAIAFVRIWRTGERSALMLLEKGRARALVRGAGLADPTWSPGGDRLAYTAVRRGVPQVLVLDLRSGRTEQLTVRGGSEPARAPDGRRIAYVSGGAPGIFVRDRTGGRERRVVARVDARSPDFSPDGRTIVFSAEVASRRAGTALFLVGAAGGRARQLTRPPALAHDVGADW